MSKKIYGIPVATPYNPAKLGGGGNSEALNTHINNNDNPHNVTAGQIGAVTQQELQDALEALVVPEGGDLATSHILNQNNPHQVTAEQIGAVSQKELQEALDSLEIPSAEVDLSGYAKTTDIPDVSGFQTEAQVNALIDAKLGVIENGSY